MWPSSIIPSMSAQHWVVLNRSTQQPTAGAPAMSGSIPSLRRWLSSPSSRLERQSWPSVEASSRSPRATCARITTKVLRRSLETTPGISCEAPNAQRSSASSPCSTAPPFRRTASCHPSAAVLPWPAAPSNIQSTSICLPWRVPASQEEQLLTQPRPNRTRPEVRVCRSGRQDVDRRASRVDACFTRNAAGPTVGAPYSPLNAAGTRHHSNRNAKGLSDGPRLSRR